MENKQIRLPEELRQKLAAYLERYYIAPRETYFEASRMPMPDCDPGKAPCEASRMPAPDYAPREAPAPKRMRSPLSLPQRLREMLEKTDAGFSQTLLKLIDKTGKKDSEVYTRANLSRQHFSKIRNNPDYRPTKPTALALCIALELDLDQTRDLIGRAGYSLTRSSKFDVIVMYFIERRNYNILDINMTLFRFDQNVLG